MKSTLKMASFWIALGSICLCSAQGLRAQSANGSASASGTSNFPGLTAATTGCANSRGPIAPFRPQQRSGQAERKSGQPSLLLISSNGRGEDSGGATIVGLWKFKFTAEGNGTLGPPNGATVDAGYVTWHSDGTELMNSGRAPTTGDFCMGVWKQVGGSTYKLFHVALAWAFDASAPEPGPGTGGADFVGPASIREEVTVDPSGNSYEGAFTLTQYNPEETTVLATITGRVTATRITVNNLLP